MDHEKDLLWLVDFLTNLAVNSGMEDAKDLKSLRSKILKSLRSWCCVRSLESDLTQHCALPINGHEYSEGDPPRGPKAPVHVEKFIAMYNRICVSLPKCQKTSAARIRKITLRLKEHGMGVYEEVFSRMEKSPFLTGNNPSGWRADLDWLIRNSENTLRVLEGRYDRRKQQKPPDSTADPDYETWIRQVEEGLKRGD